MSTETSSLSSGPSNPNYLSPFDSQDTIEDSQPLAPQGSQYEDARNNQNQSAISMSRGNIQRNENSVVLPPEIEILINEDPESCLDQQLRAILERRAKCRIRKGFMFCLMLALGLWALGSARALSTSEFRVVFKYCYTFLSYLLIETIIQFKTEKILHWRKMENLYMMVDIVVFLLTILAADLKYNQYKFPVEIVLVPLVANLIFYIRKSKAPTDSKIYNIIFRLVYIVLITIAIRKIKDIDISAYRLLEWILDWRGLISYVGLAFCILMIMYCALTAVLLIYFSGAGLYFCLKKMRDQASESLSIALGCLWLCGFCSHRIHLFVLLLPYVAHERELIDYFVVIAKFDFFFCLFTIIAYRGLVKAFATRSVEAAIYRRELEKIFLPKSSPIRKRQINLELIRLSSTYFTSNKYTTGQDKVINIDNDTNLCYICYNKAPDAVMARCGHGGVCLDCAIGTVKARGKCMECRLNVEAVLKIDLDSVREDSVKAVEAIVVKGSSGRANI